MSFPISMVYRLNQSRSINVGQRVEAKRNLAIKASETHAANVAAEEWMSSRPVESILIGTASPQAKK